MTGHILLIDDDEGVLSLWSVNLCGAGHRVDTAQSVGEARSCLAQKAPQLVISDVCLPDGDGLSLFDEIHQRDPILPVILITGHGSIPDAVSATSRGVFSYL